MADETDPLVDWLLRVSEGRSSLDISLLLPAALHRELLLAEPAVTPLARYFPTVGGDLPPDHPGFAAALRQAILARPEAITAFIRSAGVQTNETGRGLAWLLPLLGMDWPTVHLVDLGASAGLNLLAEQRAYRLVEQKTGTQGNLPLQGQWRELVGTQEIVLLDVGQGEPVQFRMVCRGETAGLEQLAGRPIPAIASRTGCDLSPLKLETAADETMLMAFVWGDQPQRLARLREALAAYHQTQQSTAPVRVYPANLPEDTLSFLQRHVPADPSYPVVIYNTYMTVYLNDKGQSLGERIGQWAAGQQRPVLWLQWEPPRNGQEPPEKGWCAWTADLWEAGQHRQWQLGWVHPHGTAAQFERLRS